MAFNSITRRPARSLLAMLGIAVSAAMLLNMVMLSSGMRESFRELLLSRGFEIRLSPQGTLPFDTEATLANATSIAESLRANPGITEITPVLGGALTVATRDSSLSAIGFGVAIASQGEYELIAGSDPVATDAVVMNTDLMGALGVSVGDTVRVAVGYDSQLGAATGERLVTVSGEARFIYLARDQRAAAMELGALQGMYGRSRADRVSLFMLKLGDGVDVEVTREWIATNIPQVTATSVASALESVDQRLSYFRQLAYILGSVSLVVGFLLVTTLVTISVNERTSEIAVMRAIGVSRAHIVQQVIMEALVLSIPGVVSGLLLGLVTARYLNHILSQFPGLPMAIDFFLFQPSSAWRALGLLLLTGIAASIFPAWRAASLAIAGTLRREAVA